VTLASIFGTDVLRYQPDGVIEFYDVYPAVRDSYEQAAEWTGLDAKALLHQQGFDGDEQLRLRAVSIALAAAQFGIHDALAEQGIRPGIVGGLSLGGMVSSCVAGQLRRRDLFRVLARGRQVAQIDFGGPVLPLCSSLEERTLRSSVEVREMFCRNAGDSVSTVCLGAVMKRHGAQLGLVIGPSRITDVPACPFPVVHVDSPKAVARALAAIFDFGVDLPGDRARR
jgi:hypothetical protein